MCAAATSAIASVTLKKRFSQAALKRSNESKVLLGLLQRSKETDVCLRGICGGTASHELFLADSSKDVVRAFDVHTARLDARDAFRCIDGERINDVAYSSMFDSLFVATWHTDRSAFSVRSFLRAGGQWNVCSRMQLASEGDGKVNLRVLSDGTLLCGQSSTDGVHVCRVLTDRSIKHSARLTMPHKHVGFDAKLSGSEKRLAAALRNGEGNGFVALLRLDKECAVPLSVIPLPGALYLLFCNDSLLIGVAASNNDVSEAISFSTKGDSLQRDRQLIAPRDPLNIHSWCLTDEVIYAWDKKSKDLLVFNCTYI